MSRKFSFILIMLVLYAVSTTAATINFNYTWNRKVRNCLLFIPSLYDSTKPLPLIIAYHGMYQSPSVMESISGLSSKGEKESFFILYPQMENSNNGWQYSETTPANDVAFTSALLDSVEKAYRVDKERIYATGFSSGGNMTYKAGYKLADRLAAIAPVAGSLVDTLIPARQLPVIHFHAKNDGSVNYSKAQTSLNFWISFNSCSTAADTILKIDGATGVMWKSNVNCDVVLYATETGQHSWPGGTASWTTPSNAINATDLIWDFFKKYTVPQSGGADSLKYIGHSFFKIKTSAGTVIYIDPYNVNEFSDSADVVLITHEHGDHNDLSKVKQKAACTVIRVANSVTGGVYQSFIIGDVTIKAVPAYNNNHSKNSSVGYIISFNGIKIYHAGDTGKISEMSDLASERITYALLPMDGVYTMTPEQAAECAGLIKAEYYIPMHTMAPPDTYSNDIIARFNVENKIIVRPGEAIQIHAGTVSGVTGSTSRPQGFILFQNYPNPFNPETKITFSVPSGTAGDAEISLKIYDINGSEITTLINGKYSAGIHEVLFNAGKLASGVYFYRIISGTYSETKKLVVMR